MTAIPCRICGYDAPGEPCPHCGGRPEEPSLRRAPVAGVAALGVGLEALFRGAGFLARGRGLKRCLVPPALLTLAAFTALCVGAWRLARSVSAQHLAGEVELSGWPDNALTDAVRWVLEAGPVLWFLRQGFLVAFLLLSSLIAWYTFSVVYEVLAGPFLDEVHGRVETRWFGADPRARIQRPNDIPTARTWRRSLGAGAVAVALAALAWFGASRWLALPALVVPFAVAGRLDREYGAWLAWVLRVEARALWIGIEVAALSLLLLLFGLPLYFVPLLGPWLYGVLAGFATAFGLVDLACERRQWTLAVRLRFARLHAPALAAFGAVTGLFFAVPVIGPLVAVPCGSVGALWLVCRLDKAPLRDGTGAGVSTGPGSEGVGS